MEVCVSAEGGGGVVGVGDRKDCVYECGGGACVCAWGGELVCVCVSAREGSLCVCAHTWERSLCVCEYMGRGACVRVSAWGGEFVCECTHRRETYV